MTEPEEKKWGLSSFGFHWSPCFLLWPCGNTSPGTTLMAEVHQYRRHTIRFTVQRSPTTLYWRARGTIEYTEGGRFWTFIMSGAIDTFIAEAEARDGFIQQAKKWVDERLGSESPP
jgi:hypothetical protein